MRMASDAQWAQLPDDRVDAERKRAGVLLREDRYRFKLRTDYAIVRAQGNGVRDFHEPKSRARCYLNGFPMHNILRFHGCLEQFARPDHREDRLQELSENRYPARWRSKTLTLAPATNEVKPRNSGKRISSDARWDRAHDCCCSAGDTLGDWKVDAALRASAWAAPRLRLRSPCRLSTSPRDLNRRSGLKLGITYALAVLDGDCSWEWPFSGPAAWDSQRGSTTGPSA